MVWTATFAASTQNVRSWRNLRVRETGRIDGTTVTDDDPANYFGDAPAIQIVKLVNGQDADTPTGLHVAAGSTVTFTYC